MPDRRGVLVGGALIAAIPIAVSGLLAALATRPRLAALAFGGEPNPSRHPADVGLDATDIEYSLGCSAWWISAADAVASVVIVHGFEPSEDPRATDPGPRLELAAVLHRSGYNCLVVSLGYGSGAHLHSGGALEADDVAAAVRWARSEADVPVAVVGFSAGGHAAVTATDRMHTFAVVTDSSFTDFGQVMIEQGVEILSAPAWLFRPVRKIMKLATGHWPVDLESWRVDRTMPMLHIHGDADEAISFDNLDRLASATGGETLVVHGAGHIESLIVNPELYSETLLDFLQRSLAHAGEPRAGELRAGEFRAPS